MKKTLFRSTIHRKNTWRTCAAQFLHPRCIYVAIKEFVLSGKYQDVFDCCFYYIYLSSKCNTHFAKMHNFCRLSQFLALEAMRCDWKPWQPIKIGRATWSLPLHFPDKFSLSFRRLYARRRANQNLNRPEGNPHSFENCAPSNGNQRKVASLSLSSVHSSNISFVIIDGGADVSP